MNILKEKLKKLLIQKGDDALLDVKYMGIGYEDIIESYLELNMTSPIHLIKNTWLDMGHGWGNGYVRIAESHKYYGKTYDDIDVSVHGGLTFSEFIKDSPNFSDGYWIGFDTAHSGDTLMFWTQDKVLEETIHLFKSIYGL